MQALPSIYDHYYYNKFTPAAHHKPTNLRSLLKKNAEMIKSSTQKCPSRDASEPAPVLAALNIVLFQSE